MKPATWLNVALLALLLGGYSSGPQAGRETTSTRPEQAPVYSPVYSDKAYFDTGAVATASGENHFITLRPRTIGIRVNYTF